MGLSFAHENPFLYHLGHRWPFGGRRWRGDPFRPFIHADGNRTTDSRLALFLACWLGYWRSLWLALVGSGGLSAGRSVNAPNFRCSKRRKAAVAELTVSGMRHYDHRSRSEWRELASLDDGGSGG